MDPLPNRLSRRAARRPHPTVRAGFHASLLTAVALLLTAHVPATQAADKAPVEAQGITGAFLDATLSVAVPGIIGKHHFKEGDSVDAGQVIVELDKRMEELEVARRQAVLDNAAEVLRRTEELVNRTRSVAREELDKHRAEQRIAQTELELAREQLRRRQIIAPFAGIVADLFNLDVGEGLQAQAPIVRLVDTRRCWITINLDAVVAQSLKLGQRASLRLETEIGTRNVEAEIRFISPVADPASGLVRVKALFDNTEAKIPAGIPALVRLPPAATSAATLPATAR